VSKEIKIGSDVVKMPLRTARRMFEREYLRRVLERHGGNVAKAADAINFDRAALHRKIAQLKVGS